MPFLFAGGANSWLVDYAGPFLNDRPPHVEVGASEMKKHAAGDFFCISNCRAATSSAIEWDVPGVIDAAAGNAVAHITVYYGSAAKSHLSEYCV